MVLIALTNSSISENISDPRHFLCQAILIICCRQTLQEKLGRVAASSDCKSVVPRFALKHRLPEILLVAGALTLVA